MNDPIVLSSPKVDHAQRFLGDCEPFAIVDVADLVFWIGSIDFQDWPQQSRTELRPAMVNDLRWHDFGAMTDGVVGELLRHFPGCGAYQRMLSVVMPGHSIEPHKDWQGPDWVCRVHVPLTSNDQSKFIVGGVAHRLAIGTAYMVNTEAEHSVTNGGAMPRVHFMFDVQG